MSWEQDELRQYNAEASVEQSENGRNVETLLVHARKDWTYIKDVVEEAAIEVLAAEVGVSTVRLDLQGVSPELQHGQVEGPASQIKDEDC